MSKAEVIGGLEQALYQTEKAILKGENDLARYKRNITAGIVALIFGIILTLVVPGLLTLLLGSTGLLTLVSSIMGSLETTETIKKNEELLKKTRIELYQEREKQ